MYLVRMVEHELVECILVYKRESTRVSEGKGTNRKAFMYVGKMKMQREIMELT